jgi:hypothetical protein
MRISNMDFLKRNQKKGCLRKTAFFVLAGTSGEILNLLKFRNSITLELNTIMDV